MDAEGLYDAIAQKFNQDPEITIARMFGGSALKAQNKVFACFYKGRLVLKLPANRVNELVATGNAEHFDSGTGRPAKEWVAIDAVRGDEWPALAGEARTFVSSMR